jgi:TatD DNase family protein
VAGLIDTHLHLARPEFDADRDPVRARAYAAGVAAFLQVGFDRLSIEAALQMAAGERASWCTAGIHPHEARSYDDTTQALLKTLAQEQRIVAIGECGLDYFRDLSPRDVQRDAFRRQIRLAADVGLPLVLHVRDAYDDARRILQEEGLPPRRGIFHAFAGTPAFARWAVGEGFLLGIGGPLTYPTSGLPLVIEGLPASVFLLETDAPWLPPQPWRGQRNEPAYLRVTAQRLAALCGTPLDDLAEITARNFERLLQVALPAEFWAIVPSQLAAPLPQRRHG